MPSTTRPVLIGLSGFKGVGKDTVGNILCTKHDFKRMAFADKVKEATAKLFSIHPPVLETWKNDTTIKVVIMQTDRGLMPRIITHQTMRETLQKMGTEVGRDIFGRDFWLDALLPRKSEDTAMADNWFHGNRVITDARFENEMYRIRELDGINVRIIRPGFEGEDHASEQEPPDWLIDHVIVNDSTIEWLEQQVDQMLVDIVLSRKVSFES